MVGVVRRLVVENRWWAAGVVVVAAVAVWLLWPNPDPPRQREYSEFTACLLTDKDGIAGARTAPVWAGLQQASLDTRAQVEFLQVDDPQTVEHAVIVLNTLMQWRCGVVFAVGDLPVAAVERGAQSFPDQRFFTIGGGTTKGNVERIDGDAQPAVRRILADAAHS